MVINGIYLVLLLGHLLGDYVLQTGKIARLKAVSYLGLLVHGGIVTITMVVFLSYYGLRGIIVGLICGILHLVVDYWKQSMVHKKKGGQFFLYIGDQAIHLVLLAVVGLFLVSSETQWLLDIFYLKIIIGIIILIFVSTVTVKTLILDIYPQLQKADFFYPRERVIDGFFCLGLSLIFFFPPWAAWTLGILIFYFYHRVEKAFSYSFLPLLIKYCCFLLIGYLFNIFFLR